jgi:hypothetical protein
MGFADSIKNFNKKVKQEVSDKIITIATELFTEVVAGTPVDKGVLINNWYAGIGKGVYNGSYSESSADSNGMSSLTQIASLKTYTGFVGKDGAVSLSNSTPYGFRAEYAGWPYPQWTGRVGKYAMIAKAFIKVVPKYKAP